ncbi:hypothetical protein VH1709_contig00008-0276 [Vibrio harveyi]|uniref:alpha-glutamyl/putrescinyl thymine pyrophosphorylase clade 3 protein n=1 Tax=Vibrio harveyi TaxID=669 RepID=UPI000D78B24A|nr:hypothetical protein [Vibrio harveyi]GBK97431.1 hypothetical protein VH1709_contig00008-0276 [Vibrio harveyi]
MKIKKHKDLNLFIDAIKSYERDNSELKGLTCNDSYETLAKQLIDSVRRIEYVKVIGERDISALRCNPHSDLFDPLRAAWKHKFEGNLNEACWLIFLSTHFGKHSQCGWKLCADIYGGLGTTVWTWDKITSDFDAFDKWFKGASLEMSRDRVSRKFGNHRKYESLRYDSNRPIQKVFKSYLDWVGGSNDHEVRFWEASTEKSTSNPAILFDTLYRSMKSVISFGRTAKFDYLTMLAKFDIVDIDPLTLYLTGATGPRDGVNLLFYGKKSSDDTAVMLNEKINELAEDLPISKLSSQVLEDALCNWQKSPDKYIYFGG